MAGGEARRRYILDQVPTMLLVQATQDPGCGVVLDEAIALAGAIYDRVVADHAPVGAACGRDGAGDSCPHQQIIALYHELLPLCPRVRTWTPARQAKLRQRWREHADLDWWKGYFSYVSESEFLTGRAHAKDRRPFTADLEWLITPAHFARIHEGKYHGV